MLQWLLLALAKYAATSQQLSSTIAQATALAAAGPHSGSAVDADAAASAGATADDAAAAASSGTASATVGAGAASQLILALQTAHAAVLARAARSARPIDYSAECARRSLGLSPIASCRQREHSGSCRSESLQGFREHRCAHRCRRAAGLALACTLPHIDRVWRSSRGQGAFLAMALNRKCPQLVGRLLGRVAYGRKCR